MTQRLGFILVACFCDNNRNLIKPLFSNNTVWKPRSAVFGEKKAVVRETEDKLQHKFIGEKRNENSGAWN
jgi:hypothetical protein